MANETKFIEIKVTTDQAISELAKIQNALKLVDEQQKAANRSTQEGKEAYASLTIQKKMYLAQQSELVKETAALINTQKTEIGYIQQLEKEVANLTLQYKTLTEAELQSAKGQQVLTALKDKRAELGKLEQAYGNYSKNVGNYASATNMLAINVGQVLKEAPNFAISARIGIMSLTNNLPMLAEALKAVRLEQKAMIEQGKAVPSMFSLISKSIFGLTGVMSILMVLMQVFGADLIKWVGSLFKGNDALKEMNKTIVELNKTVSGNLVSNAEKAMLFAIDYNKAVRDGDKERIASLEKIGKKEYGLNDERLKAIAKNVNAWRSAFKEYLQIAKDTYWNEALAKKKVDAELQMSVIKTQKDMLFESVKKELGSKYTSDQINAIFETFWKEGSHSNVISSGLSAERNNIVAEFNKINTEISKLNRIAFRDVYSTTTPEQTSKQEKVVRDTAAKLDRMTQHLVNSIDVSMNKKLEDSLKRVGTQMTNLLETTDAKTFFNRQVASLIKLYEDGIIDYTEFTDTINFVTENASKQGVEIIQGLQNDINIINKKNDDKSLDTLRTKGEMYVQYADMVYNTMYSLNDMLGALDQKELASYAKTIKGKANYDQLYEAKKIELEDKAAKRSKALGIFNATISTAEAIIKALADKSLPAPAGVALAIAAGVTGLAEIATIAATPLPSESSTSPTASSVSTSTITEKIGGGSMSSVLSAVTSGGGTSAITSGVGDITSGASNIISGFAKALENMPAPVMSWTEYETQAQRQQKLKNNRIIQ